MFNDGDENTQHTQISLNKQKLGEPLVYLKSVEQTLYSATVPIKKSMYIYIHIYSDDSSVSRNKWEVCERMGKCRSEQLSVRDGIN